MCSGSANWSLLAIATVWIFPRPFVDVTGDVVVEGLGMGEVVGAGDGPGGELGEARVSVELGEETLQRATRVVEPGARLPRRPVSGRGLQSPSLGVGAGGVVAPVGVAWMACGA
jgi:hypothetical protein